MLVNGIGAQPVVQPKAGQEAGKAGADLDINDFYKLMSAQLQNQSMFDTVDNAQFMSQMVQFSSLSQMNVLANAFQTNLAVSMIGKQVSLSTTDKNGVQQLQVGKVEQVSLSGGVPYLWVNGDFHQLSEISDIGPNAAEAPAE